MVRAVRHADERRSTPNVLYCLPAFAQKSAPHINSLYAIARGHHATPVGAVPQAEGMSQRANGFFEETFAHHLLLWREAVPLFSQARQRYDGAVAFELSFAEDE